MNNVKNDEIVVLLREILKWIKFQAWGTVKNVLKSILDDDIKKVIYHNSDGKLSSRKIAELVPLSHSQIVVYWNEWSKSNIVEPIRVRGGGLRYKKIFDLEDFGIQVPSIEKNIVE
ncbi:MAG: hypothetical protein ACTSVV_01115 [Promethearchaeota archaeon]